MIKIHLIGRISSTSLKNEIIQIKAPSFVLLIAATSIISQFFSALNFLESLGNFEFMV